MPKSHDSPSAEVTIKVRVDEIIAAIDDMHGQDPTAAELHYAQRMSHWLALLDSNPAPALAIAVRAQHLQRWECPRTEFPAGRAGYLRWRRNAAQHHARLAARLLTNMACDATLIDRVTLLIQKRDTRADGQTLEDCACLVFLETRLAQFEDEHSDADVKRIVDRTWQKMSSGAQALAKAQGLA